MAREELTIFGSDLDWDADHWKPAGVVFANLDQKSRIYREKNSFKPLFRDFAKAYYRYQQAHRRTKNTIMMRMLKCLERALEHQFQDTSVLRISEDTLDQAAVLARSNYSAGSAYQVGCELSLLASFVSDKRLVSSILQWKNSIVRPESTIRTGAKAKKQREKKLPSNDVLSALADIFAKYPTGSRDIFTICTVAMLLCAPSRISEILTLREDCEVWERKDDGTVAYGWRFQPSKGAPAMTKWIPDSMATLGQEAIKRLRELTIEARRIARWLEDFPNLFYRHPICPDFIEDEPLTETQVGHALGISDFTWRRRETLRSWGLFSSARKHSLSSLNHWIHSRLPKSFPWFDEERGVRFSEALFCLQEDHLHASHRPSAYMIWKPTSGIINDDLGRKQERRANIFERYGYDSLETKPLKVNTHQFRHLLNTVAQRGGLSQIDIARWSGRTDLKQNRVYDHMSEFELLEMLRSHDPGLSLHSSLKQISEQIAVKIPVTQQEFNTLLVPTAHVTVFGFCLHDFVMSPCQRFRDCLNCSEQVCIKGDRRLDQIRGIYVETKRMKDEADRAIREGTAGADRWYEIQTLSAARLKALIDILEDPTIENGAIIRLHIEKEFSPLRLALDSRRDNTEQPSNSLQRLTMGNHG